MSTISVLVLGLSLGVRHALDADHLAAVSAMVSERATLRHASLIGALWGVGHTLALLGAGVAVILLHLEIGARTTLALEFGVAIMLIGLGVNALRKLLRGARLHFHAHQHGGHAHVHPHLHDGSAEPVPHTHHHLRVGTRPLFVGVVHGLAGSAALMLLVLSTIPSPLLGFGYIALFGVGSIGGMVCMSALVGLPMHLTAERFARAHLAVCALAGVFSLGCGLFMAYEIGVTGGLFV